MIAIVNVGPKDDPNILGSRDYEVRINSRVVCSFRHRRADGLARCLQEASRAVAEAEWGAAIELLKGEKTA